MQKPPYIQEGTAKKHSYQMDTIAVPTAIETQKKLAQIMSTAPQKNGVQSLCPVRDVFLTLSDKWSIQVMMKLGVEKMLRFNELKAAVVPISQKMLTVTLKHLEATGLVKRTMYPQIPPKVEYSITPMGEEFLQHLVVMLDWACKNVSVIAKQRRKAGAIA